MKINTIFNKQDIKNAIFVIVGCLLSAIGVNMFLVNAKLFSGGLSGMAILMQYAFKVPAGYKIGRAHV